MEVKFTLSAKVSVNRVLVDFAHSSFRADGIIQYCHPETGQVIDTKPFSIDHQDIENLSALIELVNKEKVWETLSGGKEFMYNDFKFWSDLDEFDDFKFRSDLDEFDDEDIPF